MSQHGRTISRIPSILSATSGSATPVHSSRIPSPPFSPLGDSVSSRPSPWNASDAAAPKATPPSAQFKPKERRLSSGSGSSLPPASSTTRPPVSRPQPPGLRSDLRLRSGQTPSSSALRPPSPSGSVKSGGAWNDVPDTSILQSFASHMSNYDGEDGGSEASHRMGNLASSSSATTTSSVQVAVRLRPLSEKERLRGDREMWFLDNDHNIGFFDKSGKFLPRFRYDTTFGSECTNADVFRTIAKPLIRPVLSGINGTIFAYGVTSSGKTHTILGTERDPGLVPRSIQDLFDEVAALPSGSTVSVRLSVLEIYNEVLNDLLSGHSDLKLREDGSSGIVVDGLLEEQAHSADMALALIAQGEQARKVSATSMNEGSSRSHTITRLMVDVVSDGDGAAATGAPTRPGQALPVGRRLSATLCIIDLAGSESARVSVSKGQRVEGSYINKSLLTLGTVIHKLALGHATHVPFRDSKLTRMLQPSLSGSGARMAIVCNITPASAQGEETHNTLKFATRAKLVRVAVSRNEVVDDKVLIRRYQREIADLKQQLALLATAVPSSSTTSSALQSLDDVGVPSGTMEPAEELHMLRFKLEAERQERMRCEQEKALLGARLQSLLAHQHTTRRSDSGTALSLAGGGDRLAAARPGALSDSALPALNTDPGVVPGSPNDGAAPYDERSYGQQRWEQLHAESRINLRAPHWSSRWDAATEDHQPSAIASVNSQADMQAEASVDLSHDGDAGYDLDTECLMEQIRGLAAEFLEDEAAASSVGQGAADHAATATTPPQHETRPWQTSAGGTQQQQQQQMGSTPAGMSLSTAAATATHPSSRQRRPVSSGGGVGRQSSNGGTGRDLPPGTPNSGALPRMASMGSMSSRSDGEKDLEIQVLLADREVLQEQIVTVEFDNAKLQRMVAELSADMATLRRANQNNKAIQQASLDRQEKLLKFVERVSKDNVDLKTRLDGATALAEAAGSGDLNSQASLLHYLAPLAASAPPAPATPAATSRAPSLGLPPDTFHLVNSGFSDLRSNPEVWGRLTQLEEQVAQTVSQVYLKSQAVSDENTSLKLLNAQLQGESLDALSRRELEQLAQQATAAAERIRSRMANCSA